MSEDKIEIILKEVNGEYVDLEHMSLDALNSFMTVVESLKNISESVSNDFTYSIKKGSLCTAVYGQSVEMSRMYNSMNEAIEGNSTDDIVTSNMRNIQKEIKNSVFGYQFLYRGYEIHEKISRAKKITKKSVPKKFEINLDVVSGLINAIGGNDPNYHFDYGGHKLTIECSINQTEILKQYLYKNINSLVVKKIYDDKELKPNHKHVSLIDDDLVNDFRIFFREYYSINDFIDRLGKIYDFVNKFEKKDRIILTLIQAFKSEVFEVSEIKTILLISKPFKDNDLIRDSRIQLLELYETIKNKL